MEGRWSGQNRLKVCWDGLSFNRPKEVGAGGWQRWQEWQCVSPFLWGTSLHTHSLEVCWYECTCVCVSVRWISLLLACTAMYLSVCNPVQSLLSGRRRTELSFSPSFPLLPSVFSPSSSAHKDPTDLIRWLPCSSWMQEKRFYPPTTSFVGRGLRHCRSVFTLSRLKTWWWKGTRKTKYMKRKKCLSQKFGQICGSIAVFLIISRHNCKNRYCRCWNILKMYARVSKYHFLSISLHGKHYSRLANALWIIRQIDRLITQVNLACGVALLYVHKCAHPHVQSDVGWRRETQGCERDAR